MSLGESSSGEERQGSPARVGLRVPPTTNETAWPSASRPRYRLEPPKDSGPFFRQSCSCLRTPCPWDSTPTTQEKDRSQNFPRCFSVAHRARLFRSVACESL